MISDSADIWHNQLLFNDSYISYHADLSFPSNASAYPGLLEQQLRKSPLGKAMLQALW